MLREEEFVWTVRDFQDAGCVLTKANRIIDEGRVDLKGSVTPSKTSLDSSPTLEIEIVGDYRSEFF
jgi:hypothetical protein